MKMNYYQHVNLWWWGKTNTLVHREGIATVELQFDDNYPAIVFVKGVSVLSQNRRMGIGTEMLLLCEEIARIEGKQFLQLNADKENNWLVNWYKKLGYIIIAKDEHEFTMLKSISV